MAFRQRRKRQRGCAGVSRGSCSHRALAHRRSAPWPRACEAFAARSIEASGAPMRPTSRRTWARLGYFFRAVRAGRRMSLRTDAIGQRHRPFHGLDGHGNGLGGPHFRATSARGVRRGRFAYFTSVSNVSASLGLTGKNCRYRSSHSRNTFIHESPRRPISYLPLSPAGVFATKCEPPVTT